MKAILVIDMPNDCSHCPVSSISDYQYICDEMGRIMSEDEYYAQKPDWCPLKPIPEKMKVKAEKIEDIMHTELQLMDIFSNKIMAEVKFETDKLFALGYNACLDEILGEQNDNN